MQQRDLIVIGGGPAGSTAAAAAARAGMDVLLLEAGAHPRPHVGESLLPGIIPILASIGALEAVEAAGFERKSGSTHWNWGKTPAWDLWFEETEAYPYAWFVDRARFDAILFDAARRAGARVLSETPVREVLWDGDRAAGVVFARRGSGSTEEARARFIIDATGQAAIVGKHQGARSIIDGLQHRALWAHFRGAGRLPDPRARQALFQAGSSHWCWLFPLDDRTTSVGAVVLERDLQVPPEELFDQLVRSADALSTVLGPHAERISPVRVERDWSYRMERVAGAGWLAVGDAAGFIDPVLSTGVLLAMHSGWHAIQCIDRARRGELADDAASAEYQTHHSRMFKDLLRIVRFFYQKNLHSEDYFWESKSILVDKLPELRPQKAFLVLTSGLVDNLALEATRADAADRRERRAQDGVALDGDGPAHLDFVCIHLRHLVDPPAPLFFLVEPADPAEPTLFRTQNWHLSCMAPRYGNDPIRVPELAPVLNRLSDTIRKLDDRKGEALAGFWRRSRAELGRELSRLPPHLELVRVFGE